MTVITLACGLLPVPYVRAQGGWKWRSMQERGMGLGRLYDLRTVEIVSGKVTAVESILLPKGGASGWRRISLETDRGILPVILGPAWYLEQQNFTLAPGDFLEIEGSRVTFQDKPCLMAARVKKGQTVLRLRDKTGLPAWGGPKRRW